MGNIDCAVCSQPSKLISGHLQIFVSVFISWHCHRNVYGGNTFSPLSTRSGPNCLLFVFPYSEDIPTTSKVLDPTVISLCSCLAGIILRYLPLCFMRMYCFFDRKMYAVCCNFICGIEHHLNNKKSLFELLRVQLILFG